MVDQLKVIQRVPLQLPNPLDLRAQRVAQAILEDPMVMELDCFASCVNAIPCPVFTVQGTRIELFDRSRMS
jgi:hypothetical protein